MSCESPWSSQNSSRFADVNASFRSLQHCAAARALLAGDVPAAADFATFAAMVRLATRGSARNRSVRRALEHLAAKAPRAFAKFLSQCQEPGLALFAGAAAVARALCLHTSTLVVFSDTKTGVSVALRGLETPVARPRQTRARRIKNTPVIRAVAPELTPLDRSAAGSE